MLLKSAFPNGEVESPTALPCSISDPGVVGGGEVPEPRLLRLGDDRLAVVARDDSILSFRPFLLDWGGWSLFFESARLAVSKGVVSSPRADSDGSLGRSSGATLGSSGDVDTNW